MKVYFVFGKSVFVGSLFHRGIVSDNKQGSLIQMKIKKMFV